MAFGITQCSRTLSAKKLPQRTIDSIDEWAEQALTSWETLLAEGSLVLPPLVTDEIRSLLEAQGDLLGNEIIRCFGMDETSALVRKGKQEGRSRCFPQACLEQFGTL